MTTYYVSGSGHDSDNGQTPQTAFRTIQTAANLTRPGDVVYVMDGVYTKAEATHSIVTITRSGTPDKWITYKAYPGDRPKLVSHNWNAFAIAGASYIVIDGFELKGNNDRMTLKTAIAQKDNLNNPLTSGNGIGITKSSGSSPTYPHHIIIRNNEIYDFGGAGIYTYHADYITIENNLVYDNAWYAPYGNSGISTYQNWNSDQATGYKMIIRGNVTFNNKNLVPWHVTGTITDGNGIIVDDARNTQNSSTLGAYKGRTLIANNISYNNGGRGINVYLSDRVDILNNTTYRNSRHSAIVDGEIMINRAQGIKVFNNILYANSGEPATKVVQSSQVAIDYNLVFNSTQFYGTGTHNRLGVNPRFLDASRGNFALQNGSPAIDTGTNYFSNPLDILGRSRPMGVRLDVGAFEGAGLIQGTVGPDSLTGTRLADWMTGLAGNDRLWGDRGSDRILGQAGDDTLVGGAGDDWLIGGSGNDWLDGGVGRDRLTAGLGRDIVVLPKGGEYDVVTDFQPGHDQFKLPSAVQFNHLTLEPFNNGTRISLNGTALALVNAISPSQLSHTDFVV